MHHAFLAQRSRLLPGVVYPGCLRSAMTNTVIQLQAAVEGFPGHVQQLANDCARLADEVDDLRSQFTMMKLMAQEDFGDIKDMLRAIMNGHMTASASTASGSTDPRVAAAPGLHPRATPPDRQLYWRLAT